MQLPYGREAPTDALRRIVAPRVREHDVDVVLWMWPRSAIVA
ncbi:hypothetical protein [Streptomyces sp. ISL-43]|nr:hypothetical protein [Streptomyces sp. ISL-43]